MVFSLLLMVFGIGALCVLMYNAAVYALPMAIGVEVAFWAIHAGAGSVGGVTVGLVAGVGTFLLGQVVFSTTRSDLVRLGVALVFVVPAIMAGYTALLEIAAWVMTSGLWRHVFAVVGTIFVGGTALLRLMAPVDEPRLPTPMGRVR